MSQLVARPTFLVRWCVGLGSVAFRILEKVAITVFEFRACPTITAPICGVEQALNLCSSWQLYKRTDALVADAALERLQGDWQHSAHASIWFLHAMLPASGVSLAEFR